MLIVLLTNSSGDEKEEVVLLVKSSLDAHRDYIGLSIEDAEKHLLKNGWRNVTDSYTDPKIKALVTEYTNLNKHIYKKD